MSSKVYQMPLPDFSDEKAETNEVAEFKKMFSSSFRALFAENHARKKELLNNQIRFETLECIIFEMNKRIECMGEAMVKHG